MEMAVEAEIFFLKFEGGIFFDGVGIDDDFFCWVVFVDEDEAAVVGGAGVGAFDAGVGGLVEGVGFGGFSGDAS